MMEKHEEMLHAAIRSMGDQLTELQQKFIFYLLAIVAACVGYSINFTKDNSISIDDVILLLAFITWFISFFCGIQSLRRIELIHFHNINFLGKLTVNPVRNYGESPVVKPPDPDREKQTRLASLNRKFQIYFFFIGSTLFTIWYILDKVLLEYTLKFFCH